MIIKIFIESFVSVCHRDVEKSFCLLSHVCTVTLAILTVILSSLFTCRIVLFDFLLIVCATFSVVNTRIRVLRTAKV